jgi:hypothetical protein
VGIQHYDDDELATIVAGLESTQLKVVQRIAGLSLYSYQIKFIFPKVLSFIILKLYRN